MHVLLCEMEKYCNETRVLGIFESLETMQVHKDTNDPNNTEYWYYYTVNVNQFCDENEKSISLPSTKAIQEALHIENERERVYQHELEKDKINQHNRKEILGQMTNRIAKAVALKETPIVNMPFRVAEYLDELLDSVQQLKLLHENKPRDLYYNQKFPKMQKRLEWNISQYDDMLRLLKKNDDATIQFEAVMTIAKDTFDALDY